VGQTAERIREQTRTARQFHRDADQAIEEVLALARSADATDPELADALLEAAQELGRNGQARQGQTVQVLAQADRVKTHRGGLTPWIAKHLDCTQGAARGIAQSVREIGHLPQLSEPLSSGRIGTPTIRALTRAARAAKNTDTDVAAAVTTTLHAATGEGVGEAVRRVRLLEQTAASGHKEGLLADQRRRSYLRICPADDGMSRIEALLDPERAAIVRAKFDQAVSGWLRDRRSEHHEPVAEHLRTTEQLQAHALARFAEAFTTAQPAGPEAESEPDAERIAGLYGLLLPPHTNLVRPARPADLAEGIGLARYRIRPYPGHRRQSTWPPPLNAQYGVPDSRNRSTPMHDLALPRDGAPPETVWGIRDAAARLTG
jgi:Domain of unknown function (DUF222)